MSDRTIRIMTQADKPAVQDLTTRAFAQKDGAVLLQLVAEMDGRIVGHILFYTLGVFGKLGAAGLGPMSVDPWVQKEGIGKALVNSGLQMLRQGGVPIVFVLGHDWYYPKLGFSVEATEPFNSVYKGPHFFAVRLRHGPPMSGDLIFPRAFGDPTIGS